MTAHPVTLGDLWKPDPSGVGICPATVADLISPEIRPLVVSALQAEGVLVVEKGEKFFAGYGHWPKWAVEKLRYDVAALAEEGAVEILDALAEAQPFPPAGR